MFLSLLLLITAVIPVAHAVQFESGIPNVGPGGARGADIPDLSTYISFLYTFVLGIVGIAGFVSLVVWGTVWVASGIIDKKAMALESIKNTFIGIGLALIAYVILNTISPQFTEIKVPSLEKKEARQTSAPTYSGLIADGSSCSVSSECLPGSACNLFFDPGTGAFLGGTCERISTADGCPSSDKDANACIQNSKCKYCTIPGGGTRCIPKTIGYSNCTL